MDIITREEALEKHLPFYFTGQPCKNGHLAQRRTTTYRCVECESNGLQKHKTIERSRKHQSDWYYRNKHKKNKSCVKWQLTTIKGRTVGPKRRAARQQATVSWADEDAIREIYHQRDKLTQDTGVLHHVDHYYPLISDSVCGLHCEDNLRVIPADENIKKGNQAPE